MASPTQTVVGKGIPNPLIADDLLKNPKGPDPAFPPKSPTNSRSWNSRTTKGCIHFLKEMNRRSKKCTKKCMRSWTPKWLIKIYIKLLE